jgi:hypothetical protein
MLALVACALVFVPGVQASHAVVGPNVKVTNDNGNVDGGIGNVTPSKDAENRQANETTVSISPAASPVTGHTGDIVAEAANDYRMVPHTGDTWMPIYLSFDGGATWFGNPPFPNATTRWFRVSRPTRPQRGSPLRCTGSTGRAIR